ncbi:MAG: CoA transferase [Rhodospirillaceae bacterium TMED8]|nr:CoA transferase [Magnetovibrio sp.]OUT50949.1 MAG: CoA transferase [Rhodospirillaceae bacterium TMED8]
MSIARSKFDVNAVGPLSGVRVLDLTRLVAGNMMTLQLADMGADVIKIEPAGKGDPLRAWTEGGIAAFWKVYCRNKRSLALNFRADGAADIILKLVQSADVLVENFRPGRMEAMGLGPEVLQVKNPNLIIARISGFGQTGPYKGRPGFGSLVEALSGFASRNGFPDRPPLLPPLALADMIAGLQGAFSIMVALREVELNGGSGQVIDLSLLEPILATLGPEAYTYEITGEVKSRVGNRSNTSAPRDVYVTRDGGSIAVSASMQAMAERLFKVIGREDMINNPKFCSNTERVKNRDEVNDIVAQWVAARDREHVLAIFNEAGVTGAPVYDASDLLDDPHIRAREVLIALPDDETGMAQHHNIHPRLSQTPGKFRRAAPSLGEHTDEILQAAGIKKNEISSLRERGVL